MVILLTPLASASNWSPPVRWVPVRSPGSIEAAGETVDPVQVGDLTVDVEDGRVRQGDGLDHVGEVGVVDVPPPVGVDKAARAADDDQAAYPGLADPLDEATGRGRQGVRALAAVVPGAGRSDHGVRAGGKLGDPGGVGGVRGDRPHPGDGSGAGPADAGHLVAPFPQLGRDRGPNGT